MSTTENKCSDFIVGRDYCELSTEGLVEEGFMQDPEAVQVEKRDVVAGEGMSMCTGRGRQSRVGGGVCVCCEIQIIGASYFVRPQTTKQINTVTLQPDTEVCGFPIGCRGNVKTDTMQTVCL